MNKVSRSAGTSFKLLRQLGRAHRISACLCLQARHAGLMCVHFHTFLSKRCCARVLFSQAQHAELVASSQAAEEISVLRAELDEERMRCSAAEDKAAALVIKLVSDALFSAPLFAMATVLAHQQSGVHIHQLHKGPFQQYTKTLHVGIVLAGWRNGYKDMTCILQAPIAPPVLISNQQSDELL